MTPTTKAGGDWIDVIRQWDGQEVAAGAEKRIEAIEREARQQGVADGGRQERERIVTLYCTCGDNRHRPTWSHCRAYDLAILAEPSDG